MNKLKKYLIPVAIGAAITFSVTFARGVLSAETAKDAIMAICDGFFVGGAILMCIAGLIFTSNEGVYDGITYSVGLLFKVAYTKYEKRERETFYDYRQRKHDKKAPLRYFLISGGIFVAVSAVFLAVYYFI